MDHSKTKHPNTEHENSEFECSEFEPLLYSQIEHLLTYPILFPASKCVLGSIFFSILFQFWIIRTTSRQRSTCWTTFWKLKWLTVYSNQAPMTRVINIYNFVSAIISFLSQSTIDFFQQIYQNLIHFSTSVSYFWGQIWSSPLP